MILDVKALHAYYGQSHILHGVDLNVGDGEIVELIRSKDWSRTALGPIEEWPEL